MPYKIDYATLPSDFQTELSKLTSEARQKWEDDRLEALTDPIVLGTDILGMDFQKYPHETAHA